MNHATSMPAPRTIRKAVRMLLPTVFILPLVGRFSGVDYDAIADNTSNVLRAIIPMVGLSLLWGLFVSYRSSWLRPIFAKQPVTALPQSLWLLPVCWFGLCVIRFVSSHWASFDFSYLAILAIAMVMVGFNEELLFRGILAYGTRGSGGWSEARAMLVSALGFGLFHLPNLLVGQALTPTLIQVTYAFFMGITLYVSMRLSRSILLPVAMHALWDFATFTSKSHPQSTTLSLTSFALMLTILILNFVAIVWSLGKKSPPVP
jgi:membrane protease YdiL (CAAX protease family)